MNEVLKNTHVFVDVLRMARSDEVKQWDESAFEKAFKWAGYFEEASLHVLNYCAFIWIHTFWSVLAYDLLDNRCVDDGTIKKFCFFYYIKKWRVCTVKDHRRRQNVVRASVILDQLYLLSFFLFFYHILSSSAIYYWTDAQHHWIHLLMWSDLNCHYLVSFLENINDLPCTIWQEPDLWGFQNHDLAVIYLCTAYTTHVSTQWHIRKHCVFVNPTLHFVCLKTKIYLLIYV